VAIECPFAWFPLRSCPRLGYSTRVMSPAQKEADRPPGEAVIRLESLTKVYPEGNDVHVVLQDVSAEILDGEIVALLGRSGSGKSTLLNLVSGIDEPTSGRVLVGGTPIHSLSEEERTVFRRSNIGFVFQFFNLIPTLTVLENVLLPLELNGRSGAGGRRRAVSLLQTVGLGDRLNSAPDKLSGGEQQRVSVARALVNDPALLLADEPTGNLDAETGAQVLSLIEDLTRRGGKTLVLATHSQDVKKIADRVWHIRRTRIEEAPAGTAP
jgi:putative ABC transport system ATP-binding protein